MNPPKHRGLPLCRTSGGCVFVFSAACLGSPILSVRLWGWGKLIRIQKANAPRGWPDFEQCSWQLLILASKWAENNLFRDQSISWQIISIRMRKKHGRLFSDVISFIHFLPLASALPPFLYNILSHFCPLVSSYHSSFNRCLRHGSQLWDVSNSLAPFLHALAHPVILFVSPILASLCIFITQYRT